MNDLPDRLTHCDTCGHIGGVAHYEWCARIRAAEQRADAAHKALREIALMCEEGQFHGYEKFLEIISSALLPKQCGERYFVTAPSQHKTFAKSYAGLLSRDTCRKPAGHRGRHGAALPSGGEPTPCGFCGAVLPVGATLHACARRASPDLATRRAAAMSDVIVHIVALTSRGKPSAGTLCGRWARGLLTNEDKRDIGQAWRVCANCERAARPAPPVEGAG